MRNCMERNRLARMALVALLPCVAMSAFAKVAGPVALGVSPFADTEVSTNMPPPVRGTDAHEASFLVSSTPDGFRIMVR